MRIERLVLHGFKSFAERTELSLLPGVTAIVGPNGSGKSNLVEAIRFVVGARAGRLRARGADELIFQGTPARRPAGFAEVALALAGGLEVRRRVYRDGKQEVRLNGARASLRQVAVALAGSGLAPGGAAIIGQGQVAGAIEAAPERLLAALVEAAGLAEVEARAEEARARLAEAEERLRQRRDRVSALRAEAERLAQEAEAARRARELAAERLGIRRHLLRAAIEKAEAAVEAARSREAAAVREEAALAAETERLAAERRALLRRLGEPRDPPQPAALKAEEKRLEERLRALSREAELVEREARRLAAELAALPPLAEAPPEPPLDERALEEAERKLSAELAAEEARQKEARRRWRRYLRAEADHRARVEARARLLARREALFPKLRAIEEEVAGLEAELAARLAEAERLRKARDPLLAKRERLLAEVRVLRQEKERLGQARHLAEGPRRLLAARLPGVLGTVATRLRFPPELRQAAEAALGGRLEWILVEDEAALKRVFAWLKPRGLRATVLARDLAQPPPERPVPDLPGILGRLRERVEVPGEPRLTRTLFGETLLARDLEAALAAFRRSPRRIVTLEGERLEPSGAVSTGQRGRGGLKARARELEVAAELARAEARLAELEAALAALGEPPDPEPLRRTLAARRAELQSLKAELRRLDPGPEPKPPEPVPEPDESRLAALRAERERLLAARAALAEWRRYQDQEARRRRAPELRAALKEHEAERARLQKARARTGELLSGLRAVLARLERAAELRLEARRELAEAEARLSAARAALERRREALRAKAEEARLEKARAEVAWEAARRELAELPPGPERSGTRARLRAIEAELAALEPVNYRAEGELAELEARLAREEAELAEAERAWTEIEKLLAEIRAEYDRRLAAARSRLAERFAHYVGRLLGGVGEVEAVPGGLRLKVAPEGKRVRSLRLLSTGEKTMAALALLFALAEVREGGLPIAVLDEVDAALDEANLLRFARFLKGFKAGRQVLLVTHQKRTLEAADAVLGVTSQEGVSRVYGLARG